MMFKLMNPLRIALSSSLVCASFNAFAFPLYDPDDADATEAPAVRRPSVTASSAAFAPSTVLPPARASGDDSSMPAAATRTPEAAGSETREESRLGQRKRPGDKQESQRDTKRARKDVEESPPPTPLHDPKKWGDGSENPFECSPSFSILPKGVSSLLLDSLSRNDLSALANVEHTSRAQVHVCVSLSVCVSCLV